MKPKRKCAPLLSSCHSFVIITHIHIYIFYIHTHRGRESIHKPLHHKTFLTRPEMGPVASHLLHWFGCNQKCNILENWSPMWFNVDLPFKGQICPFFPPLIMIRSILNAEFLCFSSFCLINDFADNWDWTSWHGTKWKHSADSLWNWSCCLWGWFCLFRFYFRVKVARFN